MIAVDLGKEIIIPSSVALIGACVAGLSAMVKAWIENRDARQKAERQLELAKNRTEFVKQWIAVSKELSDDTNAVNKAIAELDEAYSEAQVAFSRTKRRSVLGQLGRLLMLVRRENKASYVVSGVFLFVSMFVWLFLCIPVPGDESFGYPAAIFSAFFTTIVLRAVAEMVVRVFERFPNSAALPITKVALRSNVATITTSANQALTGGQTVVVDASNDVFDGTFTVAGLAETIDADGATSDATTTGPTTFHYVLHAADVAPVAATGSVYLDTVREQIGALLMLRPGSSRRTYVVSALFLVSLLLFAYWSVSGASEELQADDYPLCYVDEYHGSYFGDFDSEILLPAARSLLEESGDGDVEAIATFLEFGPSWSSSYADFEIIDVEPDSDRDEEYWTLVADNGDEYVFDGYGLYYTDGTTDLYKRGLDNELAEIGDPCGPQTLTVLIEPAASGADFTTVPLFAYYPPDADLVYMTEPMPTAGRQGDGQDGRETDVTDVEGYFGRDGRFIPICSAEFEQIQPCILEERVVYDSGLYATISLFFWTGIQIIGFAIASRLFFGLIVWGFDRYSRWRKDRTNAAGPPAGSAVAGSGPT